MNAFEVPSDVIELAETMLLDLGIEYVDFTNLEEEIEWYEDKDVPVDHREEILNILYSVLDYN